MLGLRIKPTENCGRIASVARNQGKHAYVVWTHVEEGGVFGESFKDELELIDYKLLE